MPNFISIGGEWSPAQEVVSLKNLTGKKLTSDLIIASDGSHTVNAGEDFIYKGPDREAVKMLAEADVEKLGKHFRTDPDFIQATRNMGFNSIDDYLKSIGYSEEEDKKKSKEKASHVVKHDLPKKVKEIKMIGGGQDKSGNKDNDVIGGFGPERLRKPSEVSD